MMQLHRLAALLGSSTLLLLGAYACSSSDDSTTPGADAGTDTGTIETPDTGTIDKPDTGTGTIPDSGSDAGDGGIPTACSGNPLLGADAGNVLATLDGGQLYNIGTADFGYGPQYVDELGGQLVFTNFNDHEVVYTPPDGGGSVTSLLDLSASLSNDLNQSTYWNGNVYTAMAVENATGGGSLYQTPLDGGQGKAIAALSPTVFTSPSGIAITKNGTAYVTDPGFQIQGQIVHSGVVKMSIDGGAPAAVGPTDIPYVGIALNRDESRLYLSSPNGSVGYYALDASGNTTGAFTAFAKVPRYTPSGIAVDQAGNVWVSEYDTGNNGAIEVFKPDGAALWGTINTPNQRPTGVAFGGADRTFVLITTETQIFKTTTRCPGLL